MAEAGILGSDKQYAHQELARTELGAERMATISLAAASVEAIEVPGVDSISGSFFPQTFLRSICELRSDLAASMRMRSGSCCA
jgi:hypothetical protein